jgi:2-oxoglutarate dehydrogenase complex dehydrogenase (E1) component-like enzyme
VVPRLSEVLASLKQHKGLDVGHGIVSRVESASPATGSHKAHVLEQQQILAAAFGPR